MKGVINIRKKSRSIHYIAKKILIIVAAVPILMFSIFTFFIKVDAVEKRVDEIAKSNLKNFEIFMENFDENVKSNLNMFSELKNIQRILENDGEEVEEIFKSFKNNYAYKSIDLGTSDGRMYSSYYTELPDNYDPRTRPWYYDGVKGDGKISVTSPYAYILDDENLIVSYVKSIKNSETDELIGVIDIDIDFKYIEDILKNLYTNDYMKIMLLDKNNNIILEKHGESIFSINDRGYRAEESMFNDGYNQKISLNGIKYRLDRITLEDSKFSIVMLTSFEYLNFELLKVLILILFITFILMLIIIYAISQLEPVFLKPMDLLVEGIADITGGNYLRKIELDDKTPLEIDNIKNEINIMSNEIFLKTTELINQREEINGQYEEINALYEETTAMNDELNKMVDKLKESNKVIVEALSNAIEANDPYTKGHCERVKNYSVEIAKILGYSESSIQRLEFAAMLHDIGKVGVPSEILRKESKLTDKEYSIIKMHPEIGYEILKGVPYLKDIAKIVLEHHERVDGKGYPNGLKMEQIHGMAKILCVADAYDAMTTERPYRKNPLSTEEAMEELKRNTSIQFDSDVVDAFLKILNNEIL